MGGESHSTFPEVFPRKSTFTLVKIDFGPFGRKPLDIYCLIEFSAMLLSFKSGQPNGRSSVLSPIFLII